jgi:hypothetical protein
MEAWRTPKLVLRAHPPDQHAQFHLNSPAQIAAKAGSVPTRQRAGVSGWTIVTTFRIAGNYRYSERGTSDHCSLAGRDHADYASRQSTDVEAPRSPPASRNFGLNGEVRTARTKQNSPIIPPA